MMFTRVEITRFAGLQDFTLDLRNGIQVLYGDNGSGKSTLALFFRVMLYGTGSERKKEELSIRTRILPLDGGTASGRLLLEAGGRPLEISRVFGRTRRSDRLQVTWLDDGTSPVLTVEPGEYLLDLNEETFIRSFYVSELGQAVLPGNVNQLENRLMSLSVTGNENMDYSRAMKLLRQESRSIQSPRGAGSLDAFRREKKDLLAAQVQLKHLKEDAELLDQRAKEEDARRIDLKTQLAHLEEQEKALEKLRELEDYEEAILLISRKEDLEKRIREKQSNLDKTEAADLRSRLEALLSEEQSFKRDNDISLKEKSSLLERASEFSGTNDRLFNTENERVIRNFSRKQDSLQEKIALLEGCSEADFKEISHLLTAKRRIDGFYSFARSRVIWLVFWSLIFMLLAFLSLHKVFLQVNQAALLLLVTSILCTIGRGWILRWLFQKEAAVTARLKNRLGDAMNPLLLESMESNPDLRSLMASWQNEYFELSEEVESIGLHMNDLGDYLGEQARYQESKRIWERDRDAQAISEQILRERKNALGQLREAIQIELNGTGIEADAGGLSELQRTLNRIEIREKEEQELSEIMQRLQMISETCNLNAVLLGPGKVREIPVQQELDRKRTLKAQAERIREEIRALDIASVRREGEQKVLTDTLRSLQDPEYGIEKIDREIEKLERRHSVLELAIDNLEASFIEIQRDYLPRISRDVSLLFHDLTGGKYEEVILTGDYRMKVKIDGQFTSMDYLSRGTLDLLWLGLRLALCGIITRGEKAPLIFDDSFIHLDQERLRSILKVLNERIEGQIIILTCHHRESSLLSEDLT